MARTSSVYRRLIMWTGIVFGVCLVLLVRGRTGPGGGGMDLRLRPGVGLIEIEGSIMNSEPTVRLIEAFAERSDIRALLVKIESPGGGVVAAD